MITVETPLRSLQDQRSKLVDLLDQMPEQQQFILGALAVLEWLEFGMDSPVQCLSVRAAN